MEPLLLAAQRLSPSSPLDLDPAGRGYYRGYGYGYGYGAAAVGAAAVGAAAYGAYNNCYDAYGNYQYAPSACRRRLGVPYRRP
jgi:hypothetical protein